jgi:hypothetical protein
MKIQIPDTLKEDNSKGYNVSIRLNNSVFTFTGYVPDDRESFFMETVRVGAGMSYIELLKEIFFDNECFRYAYNKFNMICVTDKCTIVPENVYDVKNKDKLFSFCFDAGNHSKILAQPLKEQNAVLLYEFDTEAYEFAIRSFVDVNFTYYLYPLLTEWKKNSLNAYPKQIHTVIQHGTMNVVAYEHGELLFFNSFPYEKENDILYFITYICKQLKVNQLEDELFFYGDSSACKSVIKVLLTYFENITLVSKKMEKYKVALDLSVPMDIITLTECGL